MPENFQKAHVRSAVLLSLAMLATTAQAQQMYRCGNTFSQQPCGPDATAVGSKPAPQKPDAAGAASDAASAPRRPNWSAIARGVPEVGMTARELESAMGAPSERNAGRNGAGSDDQLVYRRDNRTIYVYVRNGVVTAVQEQSGGQAAAAAPEKAACPTPAAIRALEYEDSKIANRDNFALRSELATARACR